MPDAALLDIAHVSFLEVIRSLIGQSGSANAKGTLVRLAVKVGERLPRTDFTTLADFVQATDSGTNPIARIEGKAVHCGDGVFGLPACPFAPSIASYRNVFGGLPESYAEATAEFNKASPITDEHRVGYGAGVSPFCAVHQPMRSASVGRITIGGKPVVAYQLGCKSASGKKGLAEKWIAQAGRTPAEVEKILDANMCCYCLKVGA
jgi:hypothetical protein